MRNEDTSFFTFCSTAKQKYDISLWLFIVEYLNKIIKSNLNFPQIHDFLKTVISSYEKIFETNKNNIVWQN